MEKDRFITVIRKYLAGQASAEEEHMLLHYFDSFQSAEPWDEAALGNKNDLQASLLGRLQQSVVSGGAPERPIVITGYFLTKLWFRYAAILLLVAGTTFFLYRNNISSSPKIAQTVSTERSADILPGGNNATLTLADGSRIALDSAATGNLTRQGATNVLKLNNGSLAYQNGSHVDDRAEQETLYNTIHTPKGGQYQLTLSDGTKVWMNAESSIRFPVSFSGDKRTVTISGEVYMEVTQNPKQPFSVMAANTEVQVLGTSFNINAYGDEPAIKTTLIDGAVNIVLEKTSQLLKPGQQAIVGKTIEVAQQINTSQVVAWKNGFFDIQDKKLDEVMRQLARWYNVEVVYKAGIPDIEFGGRMGRNLKLSVVLQFLKANKLHVEQEGRTLIVAP